MVTIRDPDASGTLYVFAQEVVVIDYCARPMPQYQRPPTPPECVACVYIALALVADDLILSIGLYEIVIGHAYTAIDILIRASTYTYRLAVASIT